MKRITVALCALGAVLGIAYHVTSVTYARGDGNRASLRPRPVRPVPPARREATVKKARVEGRLNKSPSKATLRRLRVQPPTSPPMSVPKARLHTLAESTAVLRKIKGAEELLEDAPVPASAELPSNAQLLLTVCHPSGSLNGVGGAVLSLSDIHFDTATTITQCVDRDRVEIYASGRRGPVGVSLRSVQPGWYVVAGDFLPQTEGTFELQAVSSIGEDSCTTDLTYEVSRGDEMLFPLMFQVKEPGSQVTIWFHFPASRCFWFRGVTVQRIG